MILGFGACLTVNTISLSSLAFVIPQSDVPSVSSVDHVPVALTALYSGWNYTGEQVELIEMKNLAARKAQLCRKCLLREGLTFRISFAGQHL